MMAHQIFSLEANPPGTGSNWNLFGTGAIADTNSTCSFRSIDTQFHQFTHPDSLVSYGLHTSFDTSTAKAEHLLETRALSTYRASVYLRAMTYEDTIADKFLYRKRNSITGVTYSCNPNGSKGGFDDSVKKMMTTMHDTLSAHHDLPYEEKVSDTGPSEGGYSGCLSIPFMAYFDYMGSADSIYLHWHQNDIFGRHAVHFRRNRMSFDGNPPSIYESENGGFGAGPFPGDYVAKGFPFPSDSIWPATGDTNMGLEIVRPVHGADPLKAYRCYDSLCGGFGMLNALSADAIVAKQHPTNKRFAIDCSVQGWGWLPTTFVWDTVLKVDSIWSSGTLVHVNILYDHRLANAHWMFQPIRTGSYIHTNDTVHYYEVYRNFIQSLSHYEERPSSPEELSGIMYGAIAAGVTAFNVAQPFDDAAVGNWNETPVPSAADTTGIGTPGIWGIRPITFAGSWWDTLGNQTQMLTHGYNFGHQYTPYGTGWIYTLYSGAIGADRWTVADTNDANGNLPYFYLGYSNTWRAYKQIVERINQIYDSTNGRITPHPLRYMEWVNHYSRGFCFNPSSRLYSPTDNSTDQEFGVPLPTTDSITEANAFLKIDSTVPVKRWASNGGTNYIDSTGGEHDSTCYVDVGLFLDSNASYRNYAAMIVNTRSYPAIDTAYHSFFNAGMQRKDSSASLFGDIDVRKVYMKLDVSKTNTTFA
ncbi:MAG TPA: hypothetical protein VGM92_04315, partial [Candidatus Kapabacteria bacterium]